MTIIKATRATITLGNIELDVFQLLDGSYRWSANQITKAIDIRHSRVAEICASKQAQSLIGEKFQVADFSPKKLNSDVGNISGYTTEVAFFVWQYESCKGNVLAQALVFASGVEVLERRADAAFDVIRTEEERNTRFQLRFDGILSRNFWTDVIAEYIKTHDVSDNYKRFVYINVSDAVNLALFGLKAKTIRLHYDLRDGDSVRDVLPSRTLKLIDTIENAAATRVVETDSEPKQAIKDVIHLLGIEPKSTRL
jgi:hypothetical protein